MATATTLLLSVEEFQLRLSNETLLALFDDDNTRVANADAIVAVLRAATRRTIADVASEYNGVLPFPVSQIPDMAIELCFEHAMALSWPRNLDYMTTLKIDLNKVDARAKVMADELRKTVKRMIDAAAPVPANVGGGVTSMAQDPDFPTPAKPFFIGSMGDF